MLCSKCSANLPDGSHFCLKCGQPVSVSAAEATPGPTAVLVGCSGCGANLPDGAEFCPKCGKPVSSSARKSAAKSEPVVEVLPPEQPRPRRKRRVLLWVLLALLLAAIVWVIASDNPFAQGIQEIAGWKHDQTVLENPFSVSAHSFRYYKFSLPEGSLNVAIVGQFAAAADESRGTARKEKAGEKDKSADNAIEVYVLSEPAFTVWQNGYATSSVFESGRVAEGKVQADLPAGAGIYYLVFNNKFAPSTAKAIRATVLLRYKSWLPEWFRRMKDRFWNWLGL